MDNALLAPVASPAAASALVDPIAVIAIAILNSWMCVAWSAILSFSFPIIAGQTWQRLIGPFLLARCPALAQSENRSRLSYYPTQRGQPRVMHLTLPSMEKLRSEAQFGFTLGLLGGLFPDLVKPQGALLAFFFLYLVIEGVVSVLRQQKTEGPEYIDSPFSDIKRAVEFGGALIVMSIVVRVT